MSIPFGSERRWPWALGSIVLHLLLLAVVWRFAPAGAEAPPERKARAMRPDTASRKRVETVQRRLAQRAEERLRQRVEELRRIDEAMAQVERFRKDRYEERAAELAGDAMEVALAEMRQAIKHQAEALARQETQWAHLAAAVGELDAFLEAHAAFSPTNLPVEGTP